MTLRATGTGEAADRGDALAASDVDEQHHDHQDEHHGHHEEHGGGHAHAAQGIEWEDDMVEINRLTTPANMRW